MRWRLTDEQRSYQETLRDWLAKTADPATVRGWLDAGDAGTFERRFAADGWSGVGLPEEAGGQGGGLVELAITAEELGRAVVPSAGWLAAALTGPDAALVIPSDQIPGPSDLARVPLVLAGETTQRYVTGRGPVGVAAVESTVRPLLDRSRRVVDVVAPSFQSDAWPEIAARAAVLVAADALGASERMLDLTVRYAEQRHQFGRPIGSFQAVQHAAAEMLVGIEAARSIVYFAAASVDLPPDVRDPQWFLHAAAAKAQVTREASRAADTALTLHGAIGYTWEHDLQLLYKRAKLDEALYGRPRAWERLIADGLELV